MAGIGGCRWFFLLGYLLLSGCVSLSMSGDYKGPPERPASFEEYYSRGRSFTSFRSETLQKGKRFTITRYFIKTDVGPITIDYYHRKESSKSLVFVFPVLGGKNVFEDYFARYFAKQGVEAAIVHRSNEFKKPENLGRLEQIFRDNLVRDRIGIDFFEKQFGKEQFGSFGISRGAINVAMTAGVDPRLKYNVMVMGGTDMVGMFKNTNEIRIRKYIKSVTHDRGITEEEFFEYLKNNIRTDPKNAAGYIDARNTLLILSALDTTVPFHYGMKLREQIGDPRTILLLANHYTSLMYTQFVPMFPPHRDLCLFPLDYVEGEATNFYKESFTGKTRWWHMLPLRVVQAPFNWVAGLFVG